MPTIIEFGVEEDLSGVWWKAECKKVSKTEYESGSVGVEISAQIIEEGPAYLDRYSKTFWIVGRDEAVGEYQRRAKHQLRNLLKEFGIAQGGDAEAPDADELIGEMMEVRLRPDDSNYGDEWKITSIRPIEDELGEDF